MPIPPFPRPLITQCARFSAADRDLLAERRHPHTRLGLAYKIAFVRAAGRLPRQKPFEVAPELLRYVADRLSRVSPIGWENVVLYGEYVLHPGLVRT